MYIICILESTQLIKKHILKVKKKCKVINLETRYKIYNDQYDVLQLTSVSFYKRNKTSTSQLLIISNII